MLGHHFEDEKLPEIVFPEAKLHFATLAQTQTRGRNRSSITDF